MPKRELLHEWMHRFEWFDDEYGLVVVRVWTQAGKSFRRDERKLQDAAIRKRLARKGSISSERLGNIASLPYVNAIEVVDISGNGRLVYVDWP